MKLKTEKILISLWPAETISTYYRAVKIIGGNHTGQTLYSQISGNTVPTEILTKHKIWISSESIISLPYTYFSVILYYPQHNNFFLQYYFFPTIPSYHYHSFISLSYHHRLTMPLSSCHTTIFLKYCYLSTIPISLPYHMGGR